VHYAYDTDRAVEGDRLGDPEQGGKSWFFLTADYAFGHSLEKRHDERRSRPTAAPWSARCGTR
jgi:hypothetical protein